VTESVEPRWLLVTTPRDAGLSFSGSRAWQGSAAEGATVVPIVEDGEIHNPFVRGVTALCCGSHATMEQFLVELGRKFGEHVVPQTVPVN
jgi:hypothetical protein